MSTVETLRSDRIDARLGLVERFLSRRLADLETGSGLTDRERSELLHLKEWFVDLTKLARSERPDKAVEKSAA